MMKYSKFCIVIPLLFVLGATPNEEAAQEIKMDSSKVMVVGKEVMAASKMVVVKKIEPMKYVSISCQGDFSQVNSVFGRLFKWLSTKNLQPAGPPFGIYYDNPKEVPLDSCRYELGIPIGMEIVGDSLVQVKALDSMEVASTVHKGSYKTVESAWNSIYSWVYSNSYEPVGPGMEIYFNSPTEVPEDSLLTEIRVPVKKKLTTNQ